MVSAPPRRRASDSPSSDMLNSRQQEGLSRVFVWRVLELCGVASWRYTLARVMSSCAETSWCLPPCYSFFFS